LISTLAFSTVMVTDQKELKRSKKITNGLVVPILSFSAEMILCGEKGTFPINYCHVPTPVPVLL
jgi:hypothetical protein